MAQTDLNIVLRLVDEASAKIKEAQGQIKESVKGATDESEKGNEKAAKAVEKHKSALAQARTTVQNFKKEMFLFTAALAAATVAIREYAKYNDDARRQVDEFNISIAKTKVTLGAIVSEYLKAKDISVLDLFGPIGTLVKAFEKAKASGGLSEALGKSEDLALAVSDLERFNTSLKETTLLFQAGRISAEEYYGKILSSQHGVVAQNTAIAQSLTELARLQSELGNRQLLEAQTRIDEQVAQLNFYKETFQRAHAGMAAFTVTVGQAIQTNLSSALTGLITGAQTAKEAFAQLGKAMIQTVVDFMAQKLVAFALEKTLLAGTVAASLAAGSAIAAAWGPAAFLATVATLGAAAAQAPASLAAAGAASAAIMTGIGAAFKAGLSGGGASGSFAVGTPQVPSDMTANVHRGEMIIPATFSEGIRRGDLTVSGPQGGGSGEININIWYPRITNQDEVRTLMQQMGDELGRQGRYARGI